MLQHFKTDVLIVGGGPAGASTALSLLTYSDLKVTIVEYSAFDAVRVGEQVSPSLFELLEYLKIQKSDFEDDSLVKGYANIAAWGSDRLSTRNSIFSTQEESYQLDRESFDLLLLQQAAQRGADIFPNTKCTHFRQTENKEWEIDLLHQSKGAFSITAKFLVDATGRQSNICRKLGIPSTRHDELVAIGAFLQFENTSTLQQDILLETVPEGWWYCATLPNEKMTLTLFTDADIAKTQQLNKKENWNRLLANTLFVKNKVHGSISYGNPWVKNAFSQYTNTTLSRNFIAVGDAAASFDPISSMGIGFAVSSACHAAKAVIDYSNGHQNAIHQYQQNIEKIFTNYLSIKSQFYAKERRWPLELFWQRRMMHTPAFT
jgi:flavin-dependent dehydrogenase